MRCSWSSSCREDATASEWCAEHASVMVPVFAVRMKKAANASGRNRALERLDRDRAFVVSTLVTEADGPILLDSSSDALQRAVGVASEAGWITKTGAGYVAGPVEAGQHRERDSEPTAVANRPRFDPSRTVDMIVRYLERTDHIPSRGEIVKALNLSNPRMEAAVKAGRAAGLFHSARGLSGYRLGPMPPRNGRPGTRI